MTKFPFRITGIHHGMRAVTRTMHSEHGILNPGDEVPVQQITAVGAPDSVDQPTALIDGTITFTVNGLALDPVKALNAIVWIAFDTEPGDADDAVKAFPHHKGH